MKLRIIISAVILMAAVQSANGQNENTFSTDGWWKPAEPPFSPAVHDDNRVTFRIEAPHASAAELLLGEWDVRRYVLSKDENGIWAVTIGPIEPGVYQYKFNIDGTETIDLRNPAVKAGTMVYGSVVEIPGITPRYDEAREPGGQIHIHSYYSEPLRRLRDVWVYIPREYGEDPGKNYPVLYLRHGGGDYEGSWTRDGRANIILDNLISHGHAVPMLVVMTNGLTDGSWAGGSTPEGMDLLENELLSDVIPIIEGSYRTLALKDGRAIAGLSMGGGQAFVIGMRNPDKFSYIGEFSAGIFSDDNFDFAAYIPNMPDDVKQVNDAFRLVWVSCGTKDSRYQGHLNFASELESRGITHEFYESPHGHEWEFWRQQLRDFAQRLFW